MLKYTMIALHGSKSGGSRADFLWVGDPQIHFLWQEMVSNSYKIATSYSRGLQDANKYSDMRHLRFQCPPCHQEW